MFVFPGSSAFNNLFLQFGINIMFTETLPENCKTGKFQKHKKAFMM